MHTGRTAPSRKVVRRSVESPDSIDADLRYFDGDLEADEDDLLGIDSVAIEVFRTGDQVGTQTSCNIIVKGVVTIFFADEPSGQL